MLPWLYLLFAAFAFVGAMRTTSTPLMLLCLLAALALLVMWVAKLYEARVASRSRDATMMIDPVELRRLRELAEARKAAEAGNPPDAPAP